MLITKLDQVEIGDIVRVTQDSMACTGRVIKKIIDDGFDNGEALIISILTSSSDGIWGVGYDAMFFITEVGGRKIETHGMQLDLFEGKI